MKYRLSAVLLALSLLLSGCSFRLEPPGLPDIPTEPTESSEATESPAPTEPAEPPEWEDVTTNLIRGMEKSRFLKGNSGDFTFFFSADAWDAAQADTAVEHILAFLGAMAQRLTIRSGTICVGPDLTPTRRTGFAYLPRSSGDALSVYDYFSLLPVFCDEELDYGPVYGHAALRCAQLGLCDSTRRHTDAELAKFFSDPNHDYVADLTLPMLEGLWLDAGTTEYARSAAVSLVEHQGDSDLSFPADSRSLQQRLQDRRAWLDAIGARVDYTAPAWLPFVANFNNKAADYPYSAASAEAIWFFRTENVKETGFIRFVTDFYSVQEYIAFDFADARQVLAGYIPEEIPPVEIYTSFEITGTAGAIYSKSTGIVLYHGWSTAAYSVLHEYIHYLVPEIVHANRCMNESLTEALATYYCRNLCRQNNYLRDPDTYSSFSDMGLIQADGSLDLATYTDLEAYYYSTQEPGGDPYLSISGNYASRPEKLNFTNLSYAEGASMGNYMFKVYGWDEVLTHSASWEDVEALWGTDFDTIYEQWRQDNIDRLSEYFYLY